MGLPPALERAALVVESFVKDSALVMLTVEDTNAASASQTPFLVIFSPSYDPYLRDWPAVRLNILHQAEDKQQRHVLRMVMVTFNREVLAEWTVDADPDTTGDLSAKLNPVLCQLRDHNMVACPGFPSLRKQGPTASAFPNASLLIERYNTAVVVRAATCSFVMTRGSSRCAACEQSRVAEQESGTPERQQRRKGHDRISTSRKRGRSRVVPKQEANPTRLNVGDSRFETHERVRQFGS